MRRARFLLAIPAVLAFAGFGPAPRDNSSLVVDASCNNEGSYTFACYASASGGSRSYTYQWTWWQKRLGHTLGGYTVAGANPEFFESCSSGYTVYVTLTVTDSQGATGTVSRQITCRFLPD